MKKKHRCRKKKGNVTIKRISSFIKTYDPDHFHSFVLAFSAITVPIVWWVQGWDKAVILSKYLFFLMLSSSAGVNICALIYLAVKEGFHQKHFIGAVVKLAIVAIALLAMEDHVGASTKISFFGFGFTALIWCLTIVSKVVPSKFNK